ncbi:hypothetical protein [Streptomyces sp. NPDC001422]|uniref:hypothetical protein n=1 Tax=Streptomyces sp. NPDC001422 TaxID=3364575 RepID=UPI003691FDC9
MRKFLRKLFVREVEVIPVAITEAAEGLAEVWAKCNAAESAGHLTCQEVDALADLFREVGLGGLADSVIEGHAYADSDPEDWHHEDYQSLMGEWEKAA